MRNYKILKSQLEKKERLIAIYNTAVVDSDIQIKIDKLEDDIKILKKQLEEYDHFQCLYNEIIEGIKEDYYYLAIDENIGDFFLNVYNEDDNIIFNIYDFEGEANNRLTIENFEKNILNGDDLNKFISNTLHYWYAYNEE